MDRQEIVNMLYEMYHDAEAEYQKVAEIAHACTSEQDDLYEAAYRDGLRSAYFEAYKTLRNTL